MAPHRLLDGGHPWGSYFKVALIAIAAAVLTTLANNERTDQRVDALARKSAEVASVKAAGASRRAAIKIRNSNLAGCKRDNALRRDQNDTNATLKGFLEAAKVARERAVQTAKTEADRKLNQDAVNTYEGLISHFHQAPLVDCEAKYPDPTQDSPGKPSP